MMRNLGSFAALLPFTLLGLAACAEQEPAAAPLAAPPAAPVAPAPAPVVEAKKEEPKPLPLTAEQKVKAYQASWAAFNAKDFAKFQGIWAEGATSEMLDMGPPLVGPVAITETGAKGFVTGFPDATGEAQLTLVSGNNVLGVVLLRGTNNGSYVTPMGQVPPTHKKVGFLAAHSIELNDMGKIVKEVFAYDGATVAGQLGLAQMPHRKALEAGWATEKPVVVASGNELERANLLAFNRGIEGFNKHDAAVALGSAADDIVFSKQSAPADLTGKKETQKGLEEMFKAFPDAKLEVKSVWAAGDYVVSAGTWSGTNTGDMAKLKKTGKPVSVHFIEIDKYVGGKTKNTWVFMNGAAAAAQLGLLPPKAAEAKGKEAKPVAKAPEAAAKPAAAPAMKAEPAAKPAPAPATKPAPAPAPKAAPAPAPAK
jgi:predicted ester cyclase